MKTIARTILITVSLIYSCVSFADDSPLSPAFVLKPYQSLSISNLEYSKIKIKAGFSLVGFGKFEASNNAYATTAFETIRFGLPNNYELGVSQSYYRVSDDDGHIRGFQNPAFRIRKTWKTTSDININVVGLVTPKTGDTQFRAYPTYYDVGVEGVLKTSSGFITVIGIGKEFINSDQRSDSTLAYIGGYKTIGPYSLTLLGSIRSFENSPGSRDSEQNLSVAIGKSIAKNIWAQLIYRYVNLDYNSYMDDFGGVYSRSYDENQVAASLKVLF